MNKKGQTAFETIFLFAVITTFAILIISLYAGISDDTTALSLARAETNKQLAMKKDNIEINQISIEKAAGKPQDANIIIELSQGTALDTNAIKQSIQANTVFKNVIIKVQ